ncbi:Glycosyl hydrolase superfamily protein, putative isoform 2 [Hibiscus syriacus]|uniref:glucan endo-1,3-beta-D-glucosidase n=1 Tax=Hibiscus syriacus TaxID=106335 RepID=A0A6A2XHE3_HIBSY|nr:Glycosyl hydrolase superfamily protein, putative isoform 2 [Hibiscus syriacus]
MVFLTRFLSVTEGSDIGICYGLNGDNLPSAADVINLYKSCQVQNIRLYQPYPEVLEALRGSGFFVAMGSRNEDIPNFAADQSAANDWVNTNIVPYKDDVDFKWITIGNEVIPGPLSSSVPGAMNNIINVIASVGLEIMVTTVISGTALARDLSRLIYIPSTILAQHDAPVMINVYPYFAYASDPTHISAEFALFTSTTPVVIDAGLDYYNLFDAMVNAHNSALENINFGSVSIAIAETGWPTVGNDHYTSIANDQTNNRNLLNHVMQSGTSKRPGYIMPVFFLEMFNEDLKQSQVEQNFGFYYPIMNPVYPFW